MAEMFKYIRDASFLKLIDQYELSIRANSNLISSFN